MYENLGLAVLGTPYVEYFSCQAIWFQCRGHSVYFVNFPALRLSKATGPRVFIQFQPKFIVSMLVTREYRLLTFLAFCQKLKYVMVFWNFCYYRTISGWKFQNSTPPTAFIWWQPNFMTLATMVEYGLVLFLAIHQVLKFGGTLKFWYGSQWENCKMCNILKTADHRATQMKIWDSQSHVLHI